MHTAQSVKTFNQSTHISSFIPMILLCTSSLHFVYIMHTQCHKITSITFFICALITKNIFVHKSTQQKRLIKLL